MPVPPVTPRPAPPPAPPSASARSRTAAGDAFEAMVLEKMLTSKTEAKNNDWQAMANHAFATTLAASHPFDVAGMLTKDSAK